MAFFRIIIANYNSAKWIDKGLESIFSQAFSNFVVHIVDDFSTDDCLEHIYKWHQKYPERLSVHRLPERSGYPGGTRNYCISKGFYFNNEATYTLFMDSDDWMNDKWCLTRIHDAAVANNYPDIIRLSFNVLESDKQTYIPLKEQTIEEVSRSPFVASWTKAIRTDKLVKFPEKELFEDVVQHITQCDILKTLCCVSEPIIVWNRLKENDVSMTANLDNRPEQKKKVDISYWQLIADLYGLDLKHDYSKEVRDGWLAFAKQRVKEEGMI